MIWFALSAWLLFNVAIVVVRIIVTRKLSSPSQFREARQLR